VEFKLTIKPLFPEVTRAVGTPASPITAIRMLFASNGATVTETIPGAGLLARNGLPSGKRSCAVITSVKKV
jgi:hypothetical protein